MWPENGECLSKPVKFKWEMSDENIWEVRV
jgi:hypothetical protein